MDKKTMLGHLVILIDNFDQLTSGALHYICGPLKDLVEKIKGEEGETLLKRLKKILRNKQDEPTGFIVMDGRRNFYQDLHSGEWTYHPDVRSEIFPVTPHNDLDYCEWKLFSWEGNFSPEDIILMIITDDPDDRWAPASVEYGVAFGERYGAKPFSIVMLGSIGTRRGQRCAVSLQEGGEKAVRIFGLAPPRELQNFDLSTKFLAVRPAR
jgi:hypothetical protein